MSLSIRSTARTVSICKRRLHSYESPPIGLRRHWSNVSSKLESQSHSFDDTSSDLSRRKRQHCYFSSVPFYGAALPPSSRYASQQESTSSSPPLSPLQRITTLIHSSLIALNDPTRADAVAAVGEVTGSYALSNMMKSMQRDGMGRRILNERPLVDKKIAEVAFALLELHSKNATNDQAGANESITFGAAYATFLQTHNFDPTERTTVRFLSDPNLSYVMTRYRQCHDFWHVLTGLPPTVPVSYTHLTLPTKA